MTPFVIAALLLLSGCQASVEPVSRATMPAAPSGVSPAAFGLNSITYKNPETTSRITYGLHNWRCGLNRIGKDGYLSGRDIKQEELRTLFNRTLESSGFDIAGNRGWLFDDDRDIARTRYGIDADIDLVTMDLCEEGTFFPRRTGISGHALVRVGWTIRRLPRGEKLGTVTTRGYAYLPSARQEGQTILFERAFAAAAHNLGAHNQFFALVYGLAPDDLPGEAGPAQSATRQHDIKDPAWPDPPNEIDEQNFHRASGPKPMRNSAACSAETPQAGDTVTIVAEYNGEERLYPALVSASGFYQRVGFPAGLPAADILQLDSPKAPYPLYGYAVDENECLIAVSAPTFGKAGKTADGLYLFLTNVDFSAAHNTTSGYTGKQAGPILNNNETIRPLDLLAE